MNNHLLVWFVSAQSLIHRTSRIKVPLEIVQFLPLPEAGSGRGGSRGRFPVEFWFNMKVPQPISQHNLLQCLTTLTVKMLFLMFKCNFLCFKLVPIVSSPFTGRFGMYFPSTGICISLCRISGHSCWLLIPERKIPSTDWKPNSLKIYHFNIVAAKIIEFTISCWIGWIYGNIINLKLRIKTYPV